MHIQVGLQHIIDAMMLKNKAALEIFFEDAVDLAIGT